MNQELQMMTNGTIRISNLTNDDIRKPGRNFRALGPRPDGSHQFDRPGIAYFNVSLDQELADALIQNGWEVWTSYPPMRDMDGKVVIDPKTGKIVRDMDADPNYGIRIQVNSTEERRPSRIYEMSEPDENGKRHMTEIPAEQPVLGQLDEVEFDLMEITFHGWSHKNGKHAGEKAAYLDLMTYSLAKPPISDMWGDVDFGGMNEEAVPFD